VIGVEPDDGDDTQRSLAAGHPVEVPVSRSIADSLQVPKPGDLTFSINKELLEAVVTVSDQELLDTMRFLFERMKLVTEPGGAAAVAALLAGKLDHEPNTTIGLIVSGGNIGAARFAQLLGTGN
jgi:threo-3-hydroxy-L-aspartate ammonia-lyase